MPRHAFLKRTQSSISTCGVARSLYVSDDDAVTFMGVRNMIRHRWFAITPPSLTCMGDGCGMGWGLCCVRLCVGAYVYACV
jgi:hypothetical protein